MTKKEFYKIIRKPKSECDGFEIHLQHLYEHNNPKSILSLTGLDFTEMMRGKENTSGIQFSIPQKSTISFVRNPKDVEPPIIITT